MALSPQRFTRKPETVEAVQVTVENMAEVAECYGGRVIEWPDYTPAERRRFIHFGDWTDPAVAHVGDLVVPKRGDEDRARVIHQEYEPHSNTYVLDWDPALPSTAQVTEYRLSLFPDGDPMGRPFSIWVRRAVAPDLWAVWGYSGDSLDTAGNWVWRSRADADWWPFEEAMRRAEAALPTVEVMGKTARDVLADRGEGS